jgi:hypothetical protein
VAARAEEELRNQKAQLGGIIDTVDGIRDGLTRADVLIRQAHGSDA